MNSQKFSGGQLKGLVAGKVVVVCEPVEEGEYTREQLPYAHLKPIGIFRADEYESSGIVDAVLLYEQGREYPATNEKGEKILECKDCNELTTKEKWLKEPGDCPSCGIEEPKPLLVWLVKIEKKDVGDAPSFASIKLNVKTGTYVWDKHYKQMESDSSESVLIDSHVAKEGWGKK